MRYGLQKGSHSVYSLQYHLILVVKYRKRVLHNEVSSRLKEVICSLLKNIIELETDMDHIHILFSIPPTIQLSKLINLLKSTTSRILRKEFPHLEKYLWGPAFWSPSYFLATSGEVTLDILKKYVENQGK